MQSIYTKTQCQLIGNPQIRIVLYAFFNDVTEGLSANTGSLAL